MNQRRPWLQRFRRRLLTLLPTVLLTVLYLAGAVPPRHPALPAHKPALSRCRSRHRRCEPTPQSRPRQFPLTFPALPSLNSPCGPAPSSASFVSSAKT